MENCKYSVLLHRNLDPRDQEFFSHFAGKVVGQDGSFLTHFFCTELDSSHHVYLEITTYIPGKEGRMKLRIPHGFVFMISDPIDEKRQVGFVTPLPGPA